MTLPNNFDIRYTGECLRYILLYLQRLYLLLMWNLLICYEVVTLRRDRWISIRDIRIIFENSALIMVDKEPDLLINYEQSWSYCLTLQMQLFYNRPHLANRKLKNMFHFVHRLDYATSGLICVACDRPTASLLGKSFQQRLVKKQYLAIVWGHVKQSTNTSHNCIVQVRPNVFSVDMALTESLHIWPDGRKQLISVPEGVAKCELTASSRQSSTLVVVLEHGRLMGAPASRLLLIPTTGRRHQLRVHCASGLGHPIAGDLIYAALSRSDHDRSDWDSQTHGLDTKLTRMALHAYSLRVDVLSGSKKAPLTCIPPGALCSTTNLLEDVWRVDSQLQDLKDWYNVFTA